MAEFRDPIKQKTGAKTGFIRKRNAELSDFVFDKLPPQARDLEEAVLGGLMLDKDAIAEVIDVLKPESFYVEQHQHIYEAIRELFNKAQPVDILTVTDQLRKNGKLDVAGGPFYVTRLTNRVGATAGIEYHARIISEKYILRELIRISNTIIKDSYEETTDVFDLLDTAEQNLFGIAEQNLRRNYEVVGNLVPQVLKQIEKLKNKEDGLVGIASGFTGLDRLTSGWQRSDLVIVAARPGMGKTSFVLSMARNASVDFNVPIAVFSLEMSSQQLVSRLISSETGISSEKLKRGDLRPDEWIQLTTQVEKLSEAPLFIDDTPAINIFELRAKCRRLKLQHGIKMVIIDYLQLMSGSGDKKSGNREQEISNISRSLKSIAKELDIPVIALSQLSRAVETRGGDKRPQLSDLRESGAIEQDADMVIFLYRPDYYGFDVDTDSGVSQKGIAEVIVAKHRNGALDTVKVRFINKLAKFVDLDMMDEAQGLTPLSDIITMGSRMNDMPDNKDDRNDDGGDRIPF